MSAPLRLASFAAAIDRFSEYSGKLIALFTLLMMLVTCLVVILRYVFEIGSIGLQESVTYMHATVFLLSAAYTLKHQGHVRVDIFYRRYNPRLQAWVDAIGSLLFLLPICGFLLMVGWEYVIDSWAVREGSAQAGGLPGVYLLKALIPLMAITLGLQGLADVARNLTLLMTSASSEALND